MTNLPGRIKALMWIVAVFIFMVLLEANAQAVIEKYGLNELITSPPEWLLNFLVSALNILTGPWALGLIMGAAVFAIPDLPAFRAWLAKHTLRRRNVSADKVLAEECDSLAKEFYEESATLERLRMDAHWSDNDASHKDSWMEARRNEAREIERIKKDWGKDSSVLSSNCSQEISKWSFSIYQLVLMN